MKRILVFVNSFNYGGITSLIKDIYRNLDPENYEMSFVRLNWNINDFDSEVIANGNKVFYVDDENLNKIPFFNLEIKKNRMAKKICKAVKTKGYYDTAYIHANAYYCIAAAKKLGIKNIIMHSHEAISDFKGNEKASSLIALAWKKRQKVYNRDVAHKLGDSMRACIAKFGENAPNDSKVTVVHPPIDMEKFNPENYSEGDINIAVDSSAFNMIHVGRLDPVKNQKFLIDILKSISSKKKAHLYIVGDGNIKGSLIDYANKLGVADSLTFLPPDTSPAIYKLMNCSLLPSFSEAFGMVAVESQLMGVPCFASKNVPEDVNVGMCCFLPLESGAEAWAEKILGYGYETARPDKSKTDEFNIHNIVKKLERLF